MNRFTQVKTINVCDWRQILFQTKSTQKLKIKNLYYFQQYWVQTGNSGKYFFSILRTIVLNTKTQERNDAGTRHLRRTLAQIRFEPALAQTSSSHTLVVQLLCRLSHRRPSSIETTPRQLPSVDPKSVSLNKLERDFQISKSERILVMGQTIVSGNKPSSVALHQDIAIVFF